MFKPNRGGLPVLVLVSVGMGLAETEWNAPFRQGMEHYRAGRMEAAKTSWRAAVAAVREFDATDPRVAQTWNNLAAAESATGNLAAAEEAYRHSLEAWRGRTPDLEYAKTINNLASLHRLMGRFDQAAAEAEEAWQIAAKPDSSDARTTRFHILFNRAEIFSAQDQLGKAEETARELPELASGALQQAHGLQLLARLRAAAGDWVAAEDLQRESTRLFAQSLAETHPSRIEAESHLGQILLGAGKLAEARPHLERALAQSEAALGPSHTLVATALFNLARWKWESGSLAGIDPLLRRAIGIWTAAHGPRHPLVASAWHRLALVFQAQGKAAGAEELFRRALDASEGSLGPQHKQTREILASLAAFYESRRRDTAAAQVRRRLGLLPTN